MVSSPQQPVQVQAAKTLLLSVEVFELQILKTMSLSTKTQDLMMKRKDHLPFPIAAAMLRMLSQLNQC
jgi:hypothetical protein